jgi:TPR repeat protein
MNDDNNVKILKGNQYLIHYLSEITTLFQAIAGYQDELSELARFPDVYYEDPRIFKRALERVFQLIIDSVIRLSTIYLFGEKPRDYAAWEIVGMFREIIDPEVIDKFAGKNQYINKRNRMVHSDPFSDEQEKLEDEITFLNEATEDFLVLMSTVAPCPYCRSMIYINPEDGHEINDELDCPRCKKPFLLLNTHPVILKSNYFSSGYQNATYDPWHSTLEAARNYLWGFEGHETNKEKAFDLFKTAENLGCVDAYRELGQLFRFGWGCKQNNDQAMEYFEKGAEAGDNSCWVFLADMNKDNIEKAIQYWDKYFNSSKFGENYSMDASHTLQFIMEYEEYPEYLYKYLAKLETLKNLIMKECVDRIKREKNSNYQFNLPKLQLALEWICRTFEFD